MLWGGIVLVLAVKSVKAAQNYCQNPFLEASSGCQELCGVT